MTYYRAKDHVQCLLARLAAVIYSFWEVQQSLHEIFTTLLGLQSQVEHPKFNDSSPLWMLSFHKMGSTSLVVNHFTIILWPSLTGHWSLLADRPMHEIIGLL